ncbi:MAG TPA: tetratricopeptide repeat protein [Vicinamibacterales bacterium]|nr:tetratricopeptide repeat protein [Vicinamibacterales bacterium]
MTVRAFTRILLAVTTAATIAACVKKTAPVPPAPSAPGYPQYPMPDVPATLRVAPEVRTAHSHAWDALQSGDPKGAEREYTALLKTTPAFYPGETGLGFALLAEKQYKTAATHFTSALTKNDRYVPALQGQASVQLVQGDETGAIASFERILAIDPKQETVRSRLDLLRFRQVQSLIEAGRKARDAGHLEDAQTNFERALTLSPSSAMVFRELAGVESARGSLDQAEAHARRAVQLDSSDADGYAALGAILETRGKFREAAAAFNSAAKIDPRPAWKTRADALSDKADMAAVPAEFRSLGTSPSVTRGQLAALVGIRLEPVLEKVTQRVTAVATDVRGHWAEPWILPVTQAGVMDVYPNHTFQPGSTVLRSDLARVVSQLLTIIGAQRTTDLAKWRAARPVFPDLPASNVYYGSAALAVSAGVMTPLEDNKFSPRTPATGEAVTAAVARLQQIAGRQQP